MYFFFNESNKEESRIATIAGRGQAQAWDLATGEIHPISAATAESDSVRFPLVLGPYEAKVVVVGPLPGGVAAPEPSLASGTTLAELGGDWTLDLNGKQVTTPLKSWEDLGTPSFAGPATYRKQFTAPAAPAGKRVFLEIADVRDYARVKLNGKELEAHAWQPYRWDITSAFFRSRSDTALEVLALRQQVAVLKRKRPRPKLNSLDRLFWTTLRRFWSRWTDVLVIVKPETVVGWHRAGFRLYWRWRSRPRGGRPKITEEIRVLIRRLAEENPDWGAPKIHGELQKLGFVVSERSVARYLRRIRRRGDPGKRWLAFLQNHREVIAAFDFFTVPTVTFKLLYCFFVIEHGRRKILHFNVTRHPTAEWVVQQLREAFPEAGPYRYVILDRDSKFDARRHHVPEGHGSEAQTDERPGALAEWHRGKMGGKLPARDARPCHRAERTASPPARP